MQKVQSGPAFKNDKYHGGVYVFDGRAIGRSRHKVSGGEDDDDACFCIGVRSQKKRSVRLSLCSVCTMYVVKFFVFTSKYRVVFKRKARDDV